LLAWRLKQAREQLVSNHSYEHSHDLEGKHVPPILVKDLHGQSTVLDYPGKGLPLVLYVVSPHCTYCAKNMENMNSLMDQLKGRYRFAILSTSKDGLKEYLGDGYRDYPVYTDITDLVKVAYNLGKTPQIIVVSTDGRILRNWIGAYTENVERDIEDFFQINLPGI
jgi:hypothetical protein